jgi:hypothetical protein
VDHLIVNGEGGRKDLDGKGIVHVAQLGKHRSFFHIKYHPFSIFHSFFLPIIRRGKKEGRRRRRRGDGGER